MGDGTSQRPAADLLTVLAVGLVVWLVKNVVHEAVGHGGVCMLVGGKAVALSSAWWDGDYAAVSVWGRRAVRAGGTIANLVLGAACALWWRAGARARAQAGGETVGSYFVWLSAVANLFSGAGYLMVDPIGNFGDWSGFLEGLEPHWPWRIGLVLVGAGLSSLTIAFALRTMDAFVGRDETVRRTRARLLCWGPWAAGGVAFTAAGFLNPLGPKFAFTSALATFGGTFFLAWLPAWMKAPRAGAPEQAPALGRSVPWLVAGAAAAVVLFAVLAPSIRFGPG